MEMTPEDKKRIRGFMFLSEKPDPARAQHRRERGTRPRTGASGSRSSNLKDVTARRSTGATAIAGKVEAELAEMSDADAAEFLSSYGMSESGLTRLIRKTYELLGLISFFTVGEDECRAWTIENGTRAVNAAGVDPHRPGASLHPRRGHPLGPASRSRLGSQCARPRNSAPGRQGLRRQGRRRHAHPPQRMSYLLTNSHSCSPNFSSASRSSCSTYLCRINSSSACSYCFRYSCRPA